MNSDIAQETYPHTTTKRLALVGESIRGWSKRFDLETDIQTVGKLEAHEPRCLEIEKKK